MAELAVVEAVEARLAGGFTAAPIFGPNSKDPTPTDGSPFVELQFPVSDTEQMGLGRVYRETGGIRVVISHLRGHRENLTAAFAWANQIAALFRTQKFGGIETWTPNIGRLDDDNEDGNYFLVSVVVPFTYSFTG